MVEAYCLISTEPNTTSEVFKNVEDLNGVVSAEAVTGSYDLVVRVETDSFEILTETVFSEIRSVDGVTSTSTLTVVEIE